jgi:hypothetical protein
MAERNIFKEDWWVDPKKCERGYYISYGGDVKEGESIAYVFPQGKGTLAIARLFSAANDMGKALKEARQSISKLMIIQGIPPFDSKLINQIDKALAKAEGKQL